MNLSITTRLAIRLQTAICVRIYVRRIALAPARSTMHFDRDMKVLRQWAACLHST
jgi:hypothetical protein